MFITLESKNDEYWMKFGDLSKEWITRFEESTPVFDSQLVRMRVLESAVRTKLDQSCDYIYIHICIITVL